MPMPHVKGDQAIGRGICPGLHTEARTFPLSEVGMFPPCPVPTAGPGVECVKRHCSLVFPNHSNGPFCVYSGPRDQGRISESSLEPSPAANRELEGHNFPVGGGNNMGHGGPCFLKELPATCIPPWEGSNIFVGVSVMVPAFIAGHQGT